MEKSAFARIIKGVLGHPKPEPPPAEQTPPIPDTSQTTPAPATGDLQIVHRNIAAYGQRTDEGFVVFKDSKVKTTVTKTCPNNAKRQRELHAGIISAEGILQEDILLKSPNEAACFVVGNAVSGITAWKTPDGKTLRDIEASQAEGV